MVVSKNNFFLPSHRLESNPRPWRSKRSCRSYRWKNRLLLTNSSRSLVETKSCTMRSDSRSSSYPVPRQQRRHLVSSGRFIGSYLLPSPVERGSRPCVSVSARVVFFQWPSPAVVKSQNPGTLDPFFFLWCESPGVSQDFPPVIYRYRNFTDKFRKSWGRAFRSRGVLSAWPSAETRQWTYPLGSYRAILRPSNCFESHACVVGEKFFQCDREI